MRWKRRKDTLHCRIYDYLKDAGQNGLTADEAIHLFELEEGDDKPHVNSVAPWFTIFKKLGITRTIGRRPTRNGTAASVHVLTPDGNQIFKEQYVF